MSLELPLSIDPEKLAISGERLSGALKLKDLHRLSEVIDTDKGDVRYNLSFFKNDKGNIIITGNLISIFNVACQRCLNKMEMPIEISVSVGIVNMTENLEELSDDLEPFQAEEKEISLIKLIEDEILLGLPISPMHDTEQCPAADSLQVLKEKNDSPFAILKMFKQGKT